MRIQILILTNKKSLWKRGKMMKNIILAFFKKRRQKNLELQMLQEKKLNKERFFLLKENDLVTMKNGDKVIFRSIHYVDVPTFLCGITTQEEADSMSRWYDPEKFFGVAVGDETLTEKEFITEEIVW